MIWLFSNGYITCFVKLFSFLVIFGHHTYLIKSKPEFRYWISLKPTAWVPPLVFFFLSSLTSNPSSPITHASKLPLYLCRSLCHPLFPSFLMILSVIYFPHRSESHSLKVKEVEPFTHLKLLLDFLESSPDSLSWLDSSYINWSLLSSQILFPVTSSSGHISSSFPP